MKSDIVIVGGGTAGCVLAARLSEREHFSIIVVEAGPDFPTRESRPMAFKSPWGIQVIDPHFNWHYDAVLNRHQRSSLSMVRGRVIGGSGAINGASYVRGLAEDYDSWGSELWTSHQVLKAFRRAETDIDFSGKYHGSSGPIPVRRHPMDEWYPLHRAFYEAARATGVPEKPDLNVSDGFGIGPIPRNVGADGVRADTATTYLDPARTRSNLKVLGDTHARRIIWAKKRAIGIEVVHHNEVAVIEAGEIIICSGAIATPQLLLLSGVGPADELRAFGIRVIEDVPGIGKNLRDHPVAFIPLRARQVAHADTGAPGNPVLISYTASGSALRNDMAMALPWISRPESEDGLLGICCRVNLSVSTGEVRLASPDPSDKPRIAFNYLVDIQDRQRLRESVRLAVELTMHPSMSAMIDQSLSPSKETVASDLALDEWLRLNLTTEYHSCGTCRMGSPTDALAVVDDFCRVRGVEALRVVDLSIAPNCVRANTCATAVMIGERAAELILQQF